MDDNQQEVGEQSSRETFIAVILTAFLGVGACVALIVVTQGFFFWLILVSAGMGLVISLHYLLWGRRMDSSVQEERDRLEQETEPEPPWERRF